MSGSQMGNWIEELSKQSSDSLYLWKPTQFKVGILGTKAANSLAALTLIPTTDSSVTGCVLTEKNQVRKS